MCYDNHHFNSIVLVETYIQFLSDKCKQRTSYENYSYQFGGAVRRYFCGEEIMKIYANLNRYIKTFS